MVKARVLIILALLLLSGCESCEDLAKVAKRCTDAGLVPTMHKTYVTCRGAEKAP